MVKSMYAYVRDAWARPDKSEVKAMLWKRYAGVAPEGSVTRLEHPTRIDRARSLGYKAKQGIAVVRVQVRRGGRRVARFTRDVGPHAWARTRYPGKKHPADRRGTRIPPVPEHGSA